MCVLKDFILYEQRMITEKLTTILQYFHFILLIFRFIQTARASSQASAHWDNAECLWSLPPPSTQWIPMVIGKPPNRDAPALSWSLSIQRAVTTRGLSSYAALNSCLILLRCLISWMVALQLGKLIFLLPVFVKIMMWNKRCNKQ